MYSDKKIVIKEMQCPSYKYRKTENSPDNLFIYSIIFVIFFYYNLNWEKQQKINFKSTEKLICQSCTE